GHSVRSIGRSGRDGPGPAVGVGPEGGGPADPGRIVRDPRPVGDPDLGPVGATEPAGGVTGRLLPSSVLPASNSTRRPPASSRPPNRSDRAGTSDCRWPLPSREGTGLVVGVGPEGDSRHGPGPRKPLARRKDDRLGLPPGREDVLFVADPSRRFTPPRATGP